MNDKQLIRAEIVRLKETVGAGLSAYDMGHENGAFEAYEKVLSFIDSLSEEPVNEDLDEEIKRFAYTLPYSKTESIISACWVHNWTLESVIQIGKHIAQWQKEHLWHDAQGDDLPDYDKEVIVLCECHGEYKVCFGHRPDPDGWDGINPLTMEKEHFDIYTHGKRGWSIPDVKWWLDLPLPYEGKEGEK